MEGCDNTLLFDCLIDLFLFCLVRNELHSYVSGVLVRY